MRRAVWLPALVLALWALGGAVAAPPRDDDSEVFIQLIDDEDAGAPRADAGVGGGWRDGGVDGGMDAGGVDGGGAAGADGGARTSDGGRRFVDHWIWIRDGGLFPSGATDRVEVRVGHWVEVQFYRHAVLTVCDAPLVNVTPWGEAVRFFALDAGATQCGFWLGAQQPFPDRLVDVVVHPRDW